MIFLDFETQSGTDLKRVGVWKYVAHPDFKVLCMSYRYSGADSTETYFSGPCPIPDVGTETLVAHNANGFDRVVWESLGWPAPARWVDTIQLARMAGFSGREDRASSYAGLDSLAKYFFGKDSGKDKRGTLTIQRLNRPDHRTGLYPTATQEDLEVVREYCEKDVELLADIYTELQQFDVFETELRELDYRINSRGVCVDRALSEIVLGISERDIQRALDACETSTQILNSPVLLKAWLEENGVSLPDCQKKTIEETLQRSDLPPAVRAALEARRALRRVTVSKLETALARAGDDGRVRGTLSYYGAHTGRWSGRGLQPQNLPRCPGDVDVLVKAAKDGRLDEIEGSDADKASALIRPCIAAAPGKSFVVIDYASIEARVLAWLSRHDELLELFSVGGDPYVQMASNVYQTQPDRVSKSQRFLGKCLVLGCGYGMGAKKFETTAEGMGLNWAEAGITPAAAVNSYRKANAPVVRLWKELERAFREGGEVSGMGFTHKASRDPKKLDVWCTLPSGRPVVYRDAYRCCEGEKFGRPDWRLKYNAGGYDATVWGGVLAENVVQAVSRDILARHLLEAEGLGLRTVMHVHDEVVVETADDPASVQERLESLMQSPPAWAKGLPLAVEGYHSQYYRK